MELNIAICDDDSRALNTIEEYTLEYCNKNKIKTVISHFESGEKLCMRGKLDQYDILFLDIIMGELTGMDVAEKLREESSHTKLVFVTSYDEYAQNLFCYDTSDFIKKPVTMDRFNDVFQRVSANLIRGGEKFYYSAGKSERNVLKREISYLESVAHKVIIHKVDKTEDQFYGKINDARECLSELDFLRIGQSHIVNMDQIYDFKTSQVLMRNGDRVGISRKYRREVSRAYLKYRENKSRGR